MHRLCKFYAIFVKRFGLPWILITAAAVAAAAAAAAKSLQSCPTLCSPIDGGPPGSTKKPNFRWYLIIVFAGANTSTKLEGKNDLTSSANLVIPKIFKNESDNSR